VYSMTGIWRGCLIMVIVYLAIIFLYLKSCRGETDFCQALYIIETYLCPTTTTSILPEPIPEYCGEIGVVELNKLLLPIFEGDYYGHDRKIFWDEQYKLISKRSLDDFLKWYEVPSLGNKGADCADYCRIMQGQFSEWSPNTAFGMVIVGWDEETADWGRHCKNIMVDCEHRIYFIESQGNTVTEYDEEIDTIIMRER